MKYLKLFENYKPQNRAGVIPYHIENGEIKMLFFIPSDPAYGGPNFQIAKGRVDEGETEKDSALREGFEEVGLNIENVKNVDLVTIEILQGMDNYDYEYHLFAVEVYNKENFSEFGFETGEIGWLTMEEYENKGRKSQLELVKKTYNKIN